MIKRVFSVCLCLSFFFTAVVPTAFSQSFSDLNLPTPGTMLHTSSQFTPALIIGVTVHPENPLAFDFIVDSGEGRLQGENFKNEATKMIKYFLASLTVPEKEMWVNLSPYEKNRIIPEGFGLTEMGRDLLANDYILKQLTASLIYPEDNLGKEFWTRVRARVQEKFGNTAIPMNTFNKVWIVPNKAVVYQHDNSAFVAESHLKVMLEEDYMSLEKHLGNQQTGTTISTISSQVVKEILIPEIEKEVNTGKNFANLRQIYNAMILAVWYKKTLKESLLGRVYMDKNKVKGVNVNDPQVKQKIYEQYLRAFKKGAFNYIKEDFDSVTNETIPRKYFSGGAVGVTAAEEKTIYDLAQLSTQQLGRVEGSSTSDKFNVRVNLLENVPNNPQNGISDAAMKSDSDLRILPKTLEQRVQDVKGENSYLRNQGRFLETWYSPEDVAVQRPAVARRFMVPNYNADNFNDELRQHFLGQKAINTLGPTNNVQAEGLLRGFKYIYRAQVVEKDLLQVTSEDKVNLLYSDLKEIGYLDKEGRITDKFALLEYKGGNTALDVLREFNSISNEIYMLLLNKMWAKIEAFYLGGWDAMMKLGYADQARGGPEYLGKLAAEISQLFTRHLVAQQVAMRHMNPEQLAKFKEINFYIPLFIDFDEAHLKPQEMTRIIFSMGEEETMIAAIHVEDQGHGAKQCGHNANKVLTSTQQWLTTINSIRFRLQVMGLRVLIVARTDAEQADWIQSDLDGRDQEFIMGATNPIANFETNKREDLARTERNLQESMHHQQHLMSMGINVGEDEQITPATIKKSLNAFAKDWDDNYKPKWDAMFKLMVVDGNMRRYNDVIIEGQNNSLNGEGLQELHNFWKKIARIRTIDQVVEETIRNSKTSLPITPEEWRNWVNGLERSRNFDFFGAVEKKALELGIEIYNSQSWKKAVRDNRTMNINGNHIFWDQNTASFLDTTGHLWMIDSSINMAIARNKYSLAQADIQWFEQHKPDWLEVAHWAVELDKEAIELLKRKNFWGILDQYQPTQQERFKPGIVQILGKYLLGTRYTDKNGFLGALRSLMVLGITEKDSRMLLQSVVRIKANNTSPSFYWRGAKKENGETFTDEDLRTFLIKQAPFSQFNFSTYFGSVQAHADAIEFANRFLEDGTLHYAKRQVAGAQVGSGMATNPQQFAGTASGADADAAGKGSIGLGADSSKSTMRARTKAIEKIVDFKRAHELTLTLFAKANFKQVLNQVAGRDLLPEEQSEAFHYITDLIVRSSGLPLTDPISDTKYQKGMVFENEIITENDINQMSNTGQKILAHVILRLLNSLEKIKDVNLTPVNPRTGEPEKKVDHAMKTPGGINLDPALLDLQIKRDGKGIPLPLSQQTLGNMKIDGFLPVIITIQPMTDLKKLLGFAEVPLQRQQIAKA